MHTRGRVFPSFGEYVTDWLDSQVGKYQPGVAPVCLAEEWRDILLRRGFVRFGYAALDWDVLLARLFALHWSILFNLEAKTSIIVILSPHYGRHYRESSQPAR